MLVLLVIGVALIVAGCSFGEERTATRTAPDPCAQTGPWSTGPQARWVGAILKAGGYQVLAKTGSALVASGRGPDFYIWAAEVKGGGMPNWRHLATVRGVPIRGDRDVWRSWHAQGFTFWVQSGPSPTFAPAAGRLAPVVDASLRVPFPEECRA